MKHVFAPALILLLTACTTATPVEEPEADIPEQEPAIEAALPPAPPPAPPKPVFDPGIFLGLTVEDLENLYGEPRLKRGEGLARVWQYVKGDCVLHLFLYAGGEGSQKEIRVEHVEAKMRAGPVNPDLTAADVCAGPFGVIKDNSKVEADTSAPGQTGLAEEESRDGDSGNNAAQ